MVARAAAITEVVAMENMEKVVEKDEEKAEEKVEEKDEEKAEENMEKVAVTIPSLAAGNRFIMS